MVNNNQGGKQAFLLLQDHRIGESLILPLSYSLSKDILAEDFADHIRKNEMDSNYGFEKEYQVGEKQRG